MVASSHVKFIYPPALLHQPVVYQLGKQFNIVTNIRRADISDSHGWVDMELQGDARDIQRALDWAHQQGLYLEPVVIAVAAAPSSLKMDVLCPLAAENRSAR